MRKFFDHFFVFLFWLFCLAGVAATIKGDVHFKYQYDHNGSRGGPFESSNSNARYALTEAIVKRGAFDFTHEEARFASPDLVYHQGKFYSIFTPGISFVGVPFYIFGNQIGLPQLVTYLSTVLFALINISLIIAIARKIGAKKYAAYLAGFVFLFATNALVYTHSFTQHHLSTTLLLLAIRNTLGERSIFKNVLLGVIIGLAALVDIPNLFLLLPVGVSVLFQHINIHHHAGKVTYTFSPRFFWVSAGMVPFLLIFGWYNLRTTGSIVKLGQTIGRTTYEQAIKPNYSEASHDSGTSAFPFNTRHEIVGMYTLLISTERAWWYYSPVVLLGILGMIALHKTPLARIVIATIGINILLYSMFGDPWGGWAFGPRYLIPAAAGLCIFLAVAINKYRNNLWFGWLFLLLVTYSIFVSVAGALTTAGVPPYQEAIYMTNDTPATYAYNLKLISQGETNSLLYHIAVRQIMRAPTYVFIVTAALILISHGFFALSTFEKVKKEEK